MLSIDQYVFLDASRGGRADRAHLGYTETEDDVVDHLWQLAESLRVAEIDLATYRVLHRRETERLGNAESTGYATSELGELRGVADRGALRGGSSDREARRYNFLASSPYRSQEEQAEMVALDAALRRAYGLPERSAR